MRHRRLYRTRRQPRALRFARARLYDKQGRLIHVGQAGSGFNHKSLAEMWKTLKKIETKKNPFFGEVEALRKVTVG